MHRLQQNTPHWCWSYIAHRLGDSLRTIEGSYFCFDLQLERLASKLMISKVREMTFVGILITSVKLLSLFVTLYSFRDTEQMISRELTECFYYHSPHELEYCKN